MNPVRPQSVDQSESAPPTPIDEVRDAARAAISALQARPALVALLCVVVGFAIGRELVLVASSLWFGASLAALALAAGVRGWTCRAALALALVALSAGWFAARIHERPSDALSAALNSDPLAEPALITLHAVVEDWPVELSGAKGALGSLARTQTSSTFLARLLRVEDDAGALHNVSGRVAVRVQLPLRELPEHIRPGIALRITGRIEPVRPPLNPGEPDWLALARQDRREGTLRVPGAELISPSTTALTLAERMHSAIDRALGVLRHGAAGAFSTALDAPAMSVDPGSARDTPEADQARALLGAMLLGQRSSSLDPVSDAFTRQGLVHLVAISGFNLAVMGGVALFLLRLGGDRGWIDAALLALLVAGYMLVLPADAGILRSGCMMLALLLVEAFGRRYDRASVMGWIGVALLAWRPLDAFSAGFQLSFAIVAALLLISHQAQQQLFGLELRGVLRTPVEPGRIRWWRPSRWKPWLGAFSRVLKTHIATSLLAWAIATPIIACHTGVISPLAPLTGLVVLPLTVVVLWAGYAALLLGALIPPLATWIGALLSSLAHALVHIVFWLDNRVNLSVHAPRLSVALCALGVLVAVFWFTRAHRRSLLAWSLTALLIVWCGAEVLLRPRLRAPEPLHIDTLAVGDGTCHLLRSGSDAMLWDCGSLATGIGERTIPASARALGASAVPTILITHAHLDHFAGVLDVLAPLRVRTVLVSAQLERAARAAPSSGPGVLLTELARRHIRVRVVAAGDRLQLGPCTLEFLWPAHDRDFKDPNDASLVAMIHVPVSSDVAERRVLMTGDISREAAPSLLPDTPELAANLKADVLELPHHGAFLESKAELVRVVNPDVVLQSTGPVRARDQRWAPLQHDRHWFITARDGCITTTIHTSGHITTSTFLPKEHTSSLWPP